MAEEEFYQLKPPPSSAALEPEAGRARTRGVLLKAGVPAQVALRGSRWLRFQAFVLHVRAGVLERNMAQADWGTSSSTKNGTTTYLLAGPTRLERFGAYFRPDGTPSGNMKFAYEDHGKPVTLEWTPAPIDLWGTNRYHGHMESQVALTDKVEVGLPHPMARVVLSSPSLPSRIGIGIGDDTPVQVLPAQLEAGQLAPGREPEMIAGAPETCATRDLAATLNAAWQRVAGQDTAAEVIDLPLRLTSATDGVVFLEMTGQWDLFYAEPETQLTLEPLGEMTVTCGWPLASRAAQLSLAVTGEFTTGIRIGLAEPGKPDFVVRSAQQLEVAQAVLPSGQPVAREVAAVWLRLPVAPTAPQRLQVRLAPVGEGSAGPAEQPLATSDATLPADAAAYRPAPDGGVWYRAVFPKPVPLDGAQMTHPLFIVAAAGHGEGVPLCHAHAGSPGAPAAWLPQGPGKSGCALVRNLSRTGAWEVQMFHRTPNRWLVDLELVPLDGEYGTLVTVIPGGAPGEQSAPAGPDGRIGGLLTWNLPAKPAGGSLQVQVRTRAAAVVTVQPALTQNVGGS